MASDHFEKAIQAILLRSKDNGGPTLDDLLTAMIASNDDLDEAQTDLQKLIETNHKETRRLASRNYALIEKHLVEDINMGKEEFEVFIEGFNKKHEARDKRLDELEIKFEKKLDVALEAAVLAERADHKDFHQEHLNTMHGTDPAPLESLASAFPLPDVVRDMTVGWRVGRWLVALVLVAVVGWLLPFWADSCSRQQYWGKETPALVVSPTPTQSP